MNERAPIQLTSGDLFDNGRRGLSTANAAAAADAASVDADSPWLGLASFTEETHAYFFGREGEVAELTRRVKRKLLTVLFGKSGLGKTSILQAGLVPRLRSERYCPVRLRIDYGRESREPAEQIKQAIRKATVNGEWTHDVAAPAESIWEFLHHRDDVLKDASGEKLIPLLIFDQFEELFTLAQSDEFGRARAARFIEELADLVENRPPKGLEARLDSDESIAERFDFTRSDYRVVIALREDYLAPLESLKRAMPSLSQNRLRLAPMTGRDALEAVVQPGNRMRPGNPLVSDEVAEAIVRFVAGGSELANAEVEPSLLSLICRELNEQRIAQGRSEISQDLLAGSHDTILGNFYERSLADQPASVRRIIEDDLLTESGFRENLAEESLLHRFQAAGAAPDALTKLVNRRLLRIEERLDVRRAELTHDVLTGVVKASRDQRHQREAREAAERALAEQRKRENSARRALRRARAVAAACTLLAAVAVVAAVFAFISVKRAQRAEQVARQTREISEQARQQAEGLLGFLTDDFVRELQIFGRYQTILELSQREIDYFRALPASLKAPQTVRSGALALVNHAWAADFTGDPTTAVKNATEAVAVLEALRLRDHSDATAVVLGRAYTSLGEAHISDSKVPEAGRALRQAIDLLRPIAAEPSGVSEQARRAELPGLEWLGILESAVGRNEDAVRDLREVLRIGMQLGVPRQEDATIDSDYAAAGSWLAVALANAGRSEEARGAGEDSLAVAKRIVAEHPQYGEALGTKLNDEGFLSEIALDQLDPSAAVQFSTQGVQTSFALMGVESTNRLYLTRIGIGYASVADSMWAAGRLREAASYGRKAIETLGQQSAAAGGVPLSYLLLSLAATGARQAQLGDFAGAAVTIAAADALMGRKTFTRLGLHGSFAEGAFLASRAYSISTVAYEQGDFGGARRLAGNALALLEARPRSGGLEARMLAFGVCTLSDVEGRAEYALRDFAAAAHAEQAAWTGCNEMGSDVSVGIRTQRPAALVAAGLSMALAQTGRREDAARTISPVVAMYRTLEMKNRGDRWLPLELAQALYAQALTEPSKRRALLREAAERVDHLSPSIARLHDTQAWRSRIEAAQRASSGQAARSESDRSFY